MMKGDRIGSYEVTKDFEVAGGMSKISFAKKGEVEYFIKEFLAPKYPIPGAPGSPSTLEEKRKHCDNFEIHHKSLNEAIASKCSYGGNLVYAVDFFRHKTSYYKVNEKIKIESLSALEISKLSIKEKLIILRTITKSLEILHKLEIVHGDLKPDNILIKKTELGAFTTKLIDFDNSYFENKVPKNKEEVVGTPEYYSPELGVFFKDEDNIGKDLCVKSDIYTLGIIFTEYLTGEKPSFNSEKYNYTYEASLSTDELILNKSKLNKIQFDLLKRMLDSEISNRPNISEVFKILKLSDFSSDEYLSIEVIDEDVEVKSDIEASFDDDADFPKPKLRGKGLNIADKSERRENSDKGRSGLRGKLL